jgi:hypothetical protein
MFMQIVSVYKVSVVIVRPPLDPFMTLAIPFPFVKPVGSQGVLQLSQVELDRHLPAVACPNRPAAFVHDIPFIMSNFQPVVPAGLPFSPKKMNALRKVSSSLSPG